MKDKPGRNSRSALLEQARQLLDQGDCQEALSLALDVLLHELKNLQRALMAMEELFQLQEGRPAPASQEEAPEPISCWLPEPKPRILH
jgi:hypothetical protein